LATFPFAGFPLFFSFCPLSSHETLFFLVEVPTPSLSFFLPLSGLRWKDEWPLPPRIQSPPSKGRVFSLTPYPGYRFSSLLVSFPLLLRSSGPSVHRGPFLWFFLFPFSGTFARPSLRQLVIDGGLRSSLPNLTRKSRPLFLAFFSLSMGSPPPFGPSLEPPIEVPLRQLLFLSLCFLAAPLGLLFSAPTQLCHCTFLYQAEPNVFPPSPVYVFFRSRFCHPDSESYICFWSNPSACTFRVVNTGAAVDSHARVPSCRFTPII